MAVVCDLPDLPTDLFLIITRLLDPVDIIRCRAVSKAWHKEFTDGPFLRDVLIKNYGRGREVRFLLGANPDLFLNAWGTSPLGSLSAWGYAFDKVTARYCALRSGKPRLTTTCGQSWQLHNNDWIPFPGKRDQNVQDRQVPVGQWERYLRNGRDKMRIAVDLIENRWSVHF